MAYCHSCHQVLTKDHVEAHAAALADEFEDNAGRSLYYVGHNSGRFSAEECQQIALALRYYVEKPAHERNARIARIVESRAAPRCRDCGTLVTDEEAAGCEEGCDMRIGDRDCAAILTIADEQAQP
jgi:Zn finger protein HypA/HybF involved in hydrogenase expression